MKAQTHFILHFTQTFKQMALSKFSHQSFVNMVSSFWSKEPLQPDPVQIYMELPLSAVGCHEVENILLKNVNNK